MPGHFFPPWLTQPSDSEPTSLTPEEFSEIEDLEGWAADDGLACLTCRHEWIGTGVPGGSCWCKKCDIDYDAWMEIQRDGKEL